MTRFTLSLAAAAIAFAAVPAAAAPQRATIRTADLDLTSAIGQRRLDRRVAGATEAVCGSYANAGDGREDEIRACRADVSRQLGTRLAAARAGGRVAAR